MHVHVLSRLWGTDWEGWAWGPPWAHLGVERAMRLVLDAWGHGVSQHVENEAGVTAGMATGPQPAQNHSSALWNSPCSSSSFFAECIWATLHRTKASVCSRVTHASVADLSEAPAARVRAGTVLVPLCTWWKPRGQRENFRARGPTRWETPLSPLRENWGRLRRKVLPLCKWGHQPGESE